MFHLSFDFKPHQSDQIFHFILIFTTLCLLWLNNDLISVQIYVSYIYIQISFFCSSIEIWFILLSFIELGNTTLQ